ncbi:hypothetical protein ACFCZ3_20185 [Cellulosimicrobium cellulans]|uniref:hypothetical protein n=1 Tax=Cellulosimicrobium cellulans TaxID=1710 RepID=UPI0035E00C92
MTTARPARYALDVERTTTLLTSLHAVQDGDGPFSAEARAGLALLPLGYHVGDVPLLDDMSVDDLGEWDEVGDLLALAWGAELLTGPAEPRLAHLPDDDDGETFYMARLSDLSPVRVTTDSVTVRDLGNPAARGVAFAVSVLERAADLLNDALANLDAFAAAAARAASMPKLAPGDEVAATFYEGQGIAWYRTTVERVDPIPGAPDRVLVTVATSPDERLHHVREYVYDGTTEAHVQPVSVLARV